LSWLERHTNLVSIVKMLGRFGQAFYCFCWERINPFRLRNAFMHSQRSKQCGDPINRAIHHAGHHAVDDDGAGHGEQLDRCAGDQTLAFEFQRRGHHGVGEARDGHQRAGPGKAGDVIVDPQPGEHRRQRDEAHGHPGTRVLVG